MLDIFDLSGRIALITGARRGIGFAIAEGLASSGAVSVIADIQAETGDEAARLIRSRGLAAQSIPADVTRRDSVEALVSQTLRKFGQIDILVNCAGIILRKPIEEATDEEWNAMMDVNLRGVFLCSQIAGREMIKRKQGKIINISSNISQVLQPGRGIYAVTKAGVSHLTKVMALEWAPHHINVNAIAPAPTMTDLNRRYFEEHPEDMKERLQSIPLGRMGDPKDYVGTAILLASPASDFMTGQTIFVDGGSILI
ncbi:MAG: glucose 1-dehydrogenase [Deltaproteobacteria bacterium]|nr:glucose 1-dehydrogenase [Deltaproteobacteria bacterium]